LFSDPDKGFPLYRGFSFKFFENEAQKSQSPQRLKRQKEWNNGMVDKANGFNIPIFRHSNFPVFPLCPLYLCGEKKIMFFDGLQKIFGSKNERRSIA
jgi:hypothetical protein